MNSNKLAEEALQTRIKDLEQQGQSKDQLAQSDKDKIERLKAQVDIIDKRLEEAYNELKEVREELTQ